MLGWLLGNTVMVVGSFLYLLYVAYRWLDGQFSAAWVLSVFFFFLVTCHFQRQISTWNEFREMQRRTYGELPRSTFFLQLMEGNFGGLLSVALLGLLGWYVVYPLSNSPDAASEFFSPESVRHILIVGFLLFMLFDRLQPIVKFAFSPFGKVIFLPLAVLFVLVGGAHFAQEYAARNGGASGVQPSGPEDAASGGLKAVFRQGMDWIAAVTKNLTGVSVELNWVLAGLACVVGVWLLWQFGSAIRMQVAKRRAARAQERAYRPVEVLIQAGHSPSAAQAKAAIPKFAKDMLAREARQKR